MIHSSHSPAEKNRLDVLLPLFQIIGHAERARETQNHGLAEFISVVRTAVAALDQDVQWSSKVRRILRSFVLPGLLVTLLESKNW